MRNTIDNTMHMAMPLHTHVRALGVVVISLREVCV
jgi:hypothetical protein